MGPVHERSRRRLFVGVWPPPKVLGAVSGLLGDPNGSVRWVAPTNLHVTLCFLGDAEVDEVTGRLERVALLRSAARLGPTVRRLGASALVVPVTGLDALAAAVRGTLADIDPSAGVRAFSGHLTLGRIRGRTRPGSAPPPAATAVIGAHIDQSFVVDDVVLTSSELTPEGPRYATVASWPTSAPGEHRP